jgi:hypothetical protein
MSGERPAAKRGIGWGAFALVAGLVLLAGLGSAGAWLARRVAAVRPALPAPAPAQPPDPRLTYTGPYRNIRPDVQYVGDDRCTGCHQDIADSYARHPMGRSPVPAADLLDRQR